MEEITPLLEGNIYHIYNRGINSEDLFKSSENYSFFLQQYAKYVAPITDTFCYCLLKNHFHLLVRIKDFSNNQEQLYQLMIEQKWETPPNISRQFSHFFNSYAQHINHKNNRTGSLFERPFGRNLIDDEQYFTRAIFYIHTNAQKHGFVNDFRQYPHSSYNSFLSSKPSNLSRDEVFSWFGGKQQFIKFHEQALDSNTFLSDFD